MKHRVHLQIAVSVSMVLALLIVSVALAANVIIDHFDSGIQDLTATVPGGGGTGTASGVISAGGILGSERDIYVTATGGSSEAGNGVKVRINPPATHYLDFSSDAGIAGTALVEWDGTDGAANSLAFGLGNQDLTSGNTNDSMHMVVFFDDLPVDITIRAYTNSSANYWEHVFHLPGGILIGSRVDFVEPFANFAKVGTPAWTDVDAITMYINGTISPGADVRIDLLEATGGRDYGDLPSPTYPAASHIPQGLRLGTNLDVEGGSLPSANADGDDLNQAPPNDEDGVSRTPSVNWTPGTAPANGGSINVTVSGCPTSQCYLNGWIDWDNNGFGTGSGDYILQNHTVSNGTQTITFNIPAITVANNTFFARFRVCTSNVNGNAAACNGDTLTNVMNGEVEDYKWSFGPTAITLSSLTARANPSDPAVLYLIVAGILSAGALGMLIWLRRRKA